MCDIPSWFKPWEAERYYNGLCFDCGLLPRVNAYRCEDCSTKYNDYMRARHAAAKEQQLCPRCGKNPPAEGNTYCDGCLSRARKNLKRDRQRRKLIVLEAYGGFCCCCGESNPDVLCINHIHHNGAEERKKYGSGERFYKYLIKNNFPPGYDVRCHNCNWTYSFGGCTHPPFFPGPYLDDGCF